MAPYEIVFLATDESVQRWRAPLSEALAGERLHWSPEAIDPSAADIVLTAVPAPGALAPFTSLRLIQSLWMGVETLLADATVPRNAPLARMIDPHMTRGMVESVCAHALAAHLQLDEYARFQRERRWKMLRGPIAAERTVGILGMGELGQTAAAALQGLGFRVLGWSRTPRAVAGVECFAGAATRDAFLARTEILVVLLPLTPDTRGLIDANFLARLQEGAVLINLARGALVSDDDLLAALDAGRLRHAALDVFNTEPLPPEHRYWTHPRVTVTPHVAALTNPATAAAFVAENVRRLRAGERLLGLVDRARGY
ncbi:MAG: glyoxylate/hydroxypyruvate reductase A [Burkholderiales bacterium]|nr:glyoxylate/hydroxypyruvate reductase A [Burkholderiales bacterium]